MPDEEVWEVVCEAEPPVVGESWEAVAEPTFVAPRVCPAITNMLPRVYCAVGTYASVNNLKREVKRHECAQGKHKRGTYMISAKSQHLWQYH